MLIHRCAQLMLELDTEPRFALASLLSGGDGLDKSPRWMAYAAHLDEPVAVSLAELHVLECISENTPTAFTDLVARVDKSLLDTLLEKGLLLNDTESHARWRERNQVVRDVAWWPPAAIAMANGRWKEIDIAEREKRGVTMSSQDMVDAFGAAPEEEYRRTEKNTKSLALAKPKKTGFDDLLSKRKTCRNFDPAKSISAEDLSTMLRRVWGAVGTLQLAPGAVAVKKNSPAGGGLHATEAYVLI